MRTTRDLSTGTWRKSTYSNGDGGECVEVADHIPGAVPVRDSKDPHGPALCFTPEAWTAFITGLKAGTFDSGTCC
ncbi:DUF397 domain-containing protein [Streptomyces sp. NPDC001922]|uniref:DUF397 domain-containing protein n=1 Tax=Streptomyces sp. NPDC001922 TaxID=3364624 RepID=UPI0036982902